MLFNKSSTGIEELKERIGFLYATNDFNNIKTDIDIAEEEIIEIIGQSVYDRADTHYQSSSYQKTDPTTLEKLNDSLVYHIQLPVGLFAYKEFSANRDISHEDSGRKVKIDPNSEKLPFEWMLDRDEAAILRKAHKTTERLIAFLEKNEDSITEWKNSDAQKTARRLFINSAKEFNRRFPIDNSRRFFITIIPFIEEVEDTIIKSTLNPILFDEIKNEIQNNNLSEDNKEILKLVQIAIPFFSMERAIKRLSIQAIPEGVIQNYISDRMTTKASQIPLLQLLNDVAKDFNNTGMQMLHNLQQHLLKLIADQDEEIEYTPDSIINHNDSSNKHFRT